MPSFRIIDPVFWRLNDYVLMYPIFSLIQLHFLFLIMQFLVVINVFLNECVKNMEEVIKTKRRGI